ncbi:MAG: hypothetical protein RL657_867 [Pseudomonadota bacterium]|jgi:molybdate transport system ATP-binding protein
MSAGLHLHLRLQRPGFDLQADLDLPSEGVTIVYGPSGSGKTTLLRCLAGLEPQATGRVHIGTETWLDTEHQVDLPTHRRPLGYVFQEASLFEHLSVRGNLEYGLKRAGHDGARDRLHQAVVCLGLEGLLHRMPHGLSGGERQRVAIARALATHPRVLLLDEPLAALDPRRRLEVMPWLLRLREALSIPMVYVTHSVDEMTRLGDHLVVLDQGKVMAHGPLSETLVSLPAPLLPEHEQGALLNGHVLGFDTAWHLARIDLASDTLWVSDQGLTPGQPVRVRLLARDISLVTAAPTQTSIQNHWPVQIQAVVDLDHPSQRLLRLAHPAGTLLARITHRAWNQLGLKVGQRVWAQVKSVAVVR